MFGVLRDQMRAWLRPTPTLGIEQAARVVAIESLDEVRQRLSDIARTMNRHQLAGYVRARARRPVEDRARSVSLWETKGTMHMDSAIVAKALDLVVQLLCREAMLRPAPEIVRRRAA